MLLKSPRLPLSKAFQILQVKASQIALERELHILLCEESLIFSVTEEKITVTPVKHSIRET